MLIAFAGDVHGRVFHAIAALCTLQDKLGRRIDRLVQVGDLGFPNTEHADEATKRYLAADSSEADLGRMIDAHGERAEALRRVRRRFASPIYFVRGNHEDFAWLAALATDAATGAAPVDPFDLLRYVADGTVLDFDGYRVGFLGGVEELSGKAGIDMEAYRTLTERASGDVHLLVTHEGPYGSSLGYHGDVHGSRLITRLVEELRPPHHVFGHAHQMLGPRRTGVTTWLGLDGLVASAIRHPEERGLKAGCLATLDTNTEELRAVTDDWLAGFPTPFDFDRWAAEVAA